MQRGTAVVKQIDHICCNLFIPIYCSCNQDEIMTTKNVSFILVCVKSWAEPSSSDYSECLETLDSVRIGVFDEHKDISLPFINVVMNLQDTRQPSSIEFLDPEWKIHLQKMGNTMHRSEKVYKIETAEKILRKIQYLSV